MKPPFGGDEPRDTYAIIYGYLLRVLLHSDNQLEGNLVYYNHFGVMDFDEYENGFMLLHNK